MEDIKTYWFVYFTLSCLSGRGDGNAVVGSKFDYLPIKETHNHLTQKAKKQRPDLNINKLTIAFFQQTVKEAYDEYYKIDMDDMESVE